MWIDSNSDEFAAFELEDQKKYWLTVIENDMPNIVAGKYYRGINQFIHPSLNGCTEIIHNIIAIWSEPAPDIYPVKKRPPYIIFPDYKLGKNGNNEKIKVHILSEEKMKELDFQETNTKWICIKPIKEELFFQIIINKKDENDFKIRVWDAYIDAPFHYQNELSKESYLKYNNVLIMVYSIVEAWMDFFEKEGIISGHIKGEYI